jgi:pimeloyl-ACP methyl ester carboxylesterase
MHVIDGVGHFLHFEQPELMDLYEEFLHTGTIHSLTKAAQA